MKPFTKSCIKIFNEGMRGSFGFTRGGSFMVAERHRRDFGEHRFFRRDRHPAIILGWYAPSYYPYYSPYTRYYSDYDTSYLPLGTIVDMSRHGLSDHEIISAIRRSGSTYYLTTSDAAYLKENGVSESVINYMLM